MSNKDGYDFFASGAPSAKFEKPGTTVIGTITTEPTMQQQTTPEGKPKTWDDSGDPMLQLVVSLQTDERDREIEDDDGVRRVFVKGQMRTAIQQALRQAGAKGLDVGGQLAITYTHDGERSNPAFSPPKQYVAVYTAPAADQAGFFGATTNGQAAAAPTLPAGMTPEVFASLPPAAQAAILGTAAPAPAPAPAAAPPPAPMPPGMTADVWATLTPEARAALSNLVGQ